MIYFLLFKEFDFTVKNYINAEYGEALKPYFDFLYYDELLSWKELPKATYIFSDLDRLSPAQLTFTKAIWDQLQTIDPPLRLLNNPHKVLQRYDLAKALYREGINQYQVWRASEVDRVDRFPAFLRMENDHTGSLTQLIETPEALHKALRSKQRLGILLHDLLIVQFLDTSDEQGLYTKYSAYRIGDKIIPTNFNVSEQWVVKHWVSVLNEEIIDRANTFARENPHEEWLRQVFEIAGINYGRIDYGFLGDQPQVWEINVNPSMGRTRGGPGPRHEYFIQFRPLTEERRTLRRKRFKEAFEAINCEETPFPGYPVNVPTSAQQQLRQGLRKQRWTQTIQSSKASFFRYFKPMYRRLFRA